MYALMIHTDKGVPNFWLTAMKSNDVLADEVIKQVTKFCIFHTYVYKPRTYLLITVFFFYIFSNLMKGL